MSTNDCRDIMKLQMVAIRSTVPNTGNAWAWLLVFSLRFFPDLVVRCVSPILAVHRRRCCMGCCTVLRLDRTDGSLIICKTEVC